MKTIPTELMTQLRATAHTIAHLFKFEFPPRTYYLTSFKEDIWYDSQWWKAKGVVFDTIKYSNLSKADSVGLEIDNIDKWFSDLALTYILMGSPVTISLVALDNNLDVMGTMVLFYGYFDKIDSLNQQRGQVSVYNHMIKWKMPVPKRTHTATCPWRFLDKADQVTGSDNHCWKCKTQHLAANDNKPVTGANYSYFWELDGANGNTWAANTQYNPPTCDYFGKSLQFNNGSLAVIGGQTIRGMNSNATALVERVEFTSGNYSNNNGAGWYHFNNQNGTFVAENLAVGANNNVAKVGGNSTVGTWCDQSWERCVALGNQRQFGGFRFVSYLVDKEILWGRGATRLKSSVR